MKIQKLCANCITEKFVTLLSLSRQILFSVSTAFSPAEIINTALPWNNKNQKDGEFSFRGLDMMLTSISLELE